MTSARVAPRRSRVFRRFPVTTAISVIVGIVVGVIVTLLRDQFLPDRFFYDGDRIQSIALGVGNTFGDTSYGTVATVYASLGLADKPELASMLGTGLVFVTTLLAMYRAAGPDVPGPAAAVITPLTLVFGSIFLGYYSKDVFVLLIVAMVLFLPTRWYGELAIVVAMVYYASNFRVYWAIVAIGYVLLRLLRRRYSSLATTLLSAFVLTLLVAIVLITVLGVAADHYRLAANRHRTDGIDAQSMIEPFVSLPEPMGGLLNTLLTLPSLMIPIPLALKATVYYLFLSVVVGIVWVLFFVGVARLHANRSLLERRERLITDRSVALVIAFVATQALFEPDYGSTLRHLAPLLPLMLVVVWIGSALRNRTLATNVLGPPLRLPRAAAPVPVH